MIYVLIIFHIILFVESYQIFQKKLCRTAILLGLINFIVLILNLIEFWALFTIKDISSIVFMQKKLQDTFILTFPLLLLNILLLILSFFTLKKACTKKKQNKFIYLIITFFCILEIIFFTAIIFTKAADFLLFLYLIIIIIYLIKKVLTNQKNYLILTLIVLFAFTFYSYFTYEGQARLQIALIGYVKDAYDTGLEEQKYLREENIKKYVPIKQMQIPNGDLGMIEIKNYFFIKFGNIQKF